MEAVVLDGKNFVNSAPQDLHRHDIGVRDIPASGTSYSEDKDEDKSGEYEEKSKKEYGKSSVSKETDTSAADWYDVLAFLQAVAVKVPRV